jgi:hypothetical protein
MWSRLAPLVIGVIAAAVVAIGVALVVIDMFGEVANAFTSTVP